MKFHDYPSLRSRMARDSEQGRNWARRYNPREFRKSVLAMQSQASEAGEEDATLNFAALASAETQWAEAERPFYNIWPVASEMATSVKLELPFSSVIPPYASIALKFAAGHEPYGVTSALLFWYSDSTGNAIAVFPVTKKLNEQVVIGHLYSDPDTVVEEWLQNAKSDANYKNIHEHLIRLVVFVGLLANDRDLITPFVMSKGSEQVRRYG